MWDHIRLLSDKESYKETLNIKIIKEKLMKVLYTLGNVNLYTFFDNL